MAASSSSSTLKVWHDGRDSALAKVVLPLSSDNHKGSSGRIAVLGGSARYTGAPYYAAMAALHAGSDVATVFTAHEAALPIKCYSPELMVLPVYKAADFDAIVQTQDFDSVHARELVHQMISDVVAALDRMHCLIVGPGLGRCPLVMKAVTDILKKAMEMKVWIVADADALYMLSLKPCRNLLEGYDRVILTPNVMEYQRLFDGNDVADDTAFASAAIVRKGKVDSILQHNEEVLVCQEEGGLKRSGGLGDILSGTLGAVMAWHSVLEERGVASPQDVPLACWTACCFVKRATKRAFDNKRRSMTAPDVLHELGPAIDEMTTWQV